MRQAFFGIRTVDGTKRAGAWVVDLDDIGAAWEPTDESPETVLCPGFVDIHIHGAFGVDAMTATSEQFWDLCGRLAECGYEGFLPTSVTASAQDVASMLNQMPEHEMILGFHLEGPFLSPEYPGAQPPSFIVDPPVGASEWDEILDDPRLKVVTLAPERPGGLALVRRLASRRVVVSMGHTNATFDQAQEAFEAGARHSTHTFNAMRGFHHREAGMAGFALAAEVRAELIYDRRHVSPGAAQALLRANPNVIAVSDSTLATGMPPGTKLKMWGLECEVGVLEIRLAENGALAGSAITLEHAFRHLAQDFGWPAAVDACCLQPREALGIAAQAPRVWLETSLQGELLAIHRR